jgi:hypothetical protein
MQIRNGEFDCGTVGGAREPEIQILTALAGLEEKDDVAGVQFGEGVEEHVVSATLFGIEFILFVCMGEERGEVGEEISVSTNTKSTNHPSYSIISL